MKKLAVSLLYRNPTLIVVSMWLVCLVVAWPGSLGAAVTVTISGLRGGRALDLGELDGSRRPTHEEVTIQMSNTSTTQYQLIQLLSSPLVNERGATLDASTMTIEINGGDSGTVRFRGASPLPTSTTELFTSNASGQTETLRLLYTALPGELPQAGTYVGAITYTLSAVDGSSVETSTVQIRLLVHPVVSLALADGSPDRVHVGSAEPGETLHPQPVSLLLSRNTAEPFQITQSVEEPVVTEQGDTLPLSALTVSALSDGSSLQHVAVIPRMTLLTSEQGAVTMHRIELSYEVSVPPDQRAGFYRGMLRLALAGPSGVGGEAATVHLPLDVEVLPVLSLSVSSPLSAQLELMFANLRGGETSPPQTLQFEVRANTGKPYGVFQELSRLLVSDEGRQLPEEAFTCAREGASDHGASQIMREDKVPLGKSVLYQSDPAGSPTQFSITYRVHIPEYEAAGVYRSSLLFTVTTL